jgi:hypothetical protein
MTHVPHVPCTQAWPPSHWAFVVHATHAPLMQASPLGDVPRPSSPAWMQSPFVEHAPHRPAMQVWPFAQSDPDWQVPHSLPFTQPCPAWQEAAVEQVQVPPLHVPLDPQSPFDAQAPQTPALQTCPLWQSKAVWQAVVHVPPAHA